MHKKKSLRGRILGVGGVAIVCAVILRTAIVRNAAPRPAAVKIEMAEMVKEERRSAFTRGYQEDAQWPTDAEREHDVATASEIEASIPEFEQFTRRVLAAKYIPADLREHVFGLKKWNPQKEDVLFADYECNGARIWVKDTPMDYIVKIVSARLAAHGDKWEPLLRDLCGEYFNNSERLLSYTKLYVRYMAETEIKSISLTLPPPVRTAGAGGIPSWIPYSTDLWYSGNPRAIWLDGKTAIIEVWKMENGGEDAIGPNFGISQRFPPLAEVIKDYSTEELVKYIASTRNVHNRHVAWRLYRERHDQETVIPLLISIYENAATGDEDLRAPVIRALTGLVATRPGPYRDRVRELIVNDLADKERSNSMTMGDTLTKALRRLPATPSNAPSESQHPVPQ